VLRSLWMLGSLKASTIAIVWPDPHVLEDEQDSESKP